MKPLKTKYKQVHAPRSQNGVGDYSGVGVRNKIGRIRDVYPTNPVSATLSKKAPKSLA